MDLQLPTISGVEVTRELVRRDPTVRVLVLSAGGERADVLAAVKAGALGYLTKSAFRAELLAAVASVAAGEAVFTPGLAVVLGEFRRIADTATDASAAPQLTPREIEVLRLVAKCRKATVRSPSSW